MKKNRLIIILLFYSIIFVASAENEKFDWMEQSFEDAVKNNPISLVPYEDSFLDSTNVSLNAKTGKWKNTGLKVTQGKLLKLKTNLNTSNNIRDYWVIYRLDPRFSRSEVFILEFDSKNKQYIFDYDSLNISEDIDEQEKLKLIDDYIFFKNRKKIPIYKNDILNITLEDKLPINLNTEILQLDTKGLDNRILYVDSESWCQIFDNADCRNIKGETVYYPGKSDICSGIVNDFKFLSKMPTIKLCDDTSLGKNFTKDNFCLYGRGLLMNISVNDNIIKKFDQSFLRTNIDKGKYTFYSAITEDGELDFLSHTPTSSQEIFHFDEVNEWLYENMLMFTNSSIINDADIGLENIGVKLLNAGRYIMHVQISNNNNTVLLSDFDIEYVIMDDGKNPENTTTGTKINDSSYRTDASKNGILWIKAKSRNENITGNININCITYKGSSKLSEFISYKIVNPVIGIFRETTEKIYNNLIRNKFFQNTIAAVLSLYFVIYGIYFLMGNIKMTTNDLVQRVSKVIVIYAMFNEHSWNFFYNHCFTIFLDGMDYLIRGVVDLTSSTKNIFGFIDPIIDRYLNSSLWGLLFIQLLQIHNGLTIFAIITMYSIFIYLKALIKIIVQYILALLTMSILISLAPLFIIFILFKPTEDFFFNWISYIFAQMIIPTIVLLIFLFIDQIASLPLSQAVLQAHWTWLFELDIKLPFVDMLPPIVQPKIIIPIPFYKSILPDSNIMVPTLLLLIYSTIVKNLIEYASNLILAITRVGPGRQEGVRSSAATPADTIAEIITLESPVAAVSEAVFRKKPVGNAI